MQTDFEQRLRDALQTRAADVRPDPQTWNRVQEGIRRQQTFRWLYAGLAATAAAAIVAFAIVALPGLLNPDEPTRVEFADTPPPEAEEPAPIQESTAPALGLSTGGYVSTDGARIVLRDDTGAEVRILSDPTADGGGGEEATSFREVVVRPGSTLGDLTVVWRRGIDCGATLGWERFVDGEPVSGGDVPFVDCPGAPVFSPDGQHLAWTEGDPSDPTAFSLRTVDWTDDGPGTRDAAFPLEFPEELFLVSATDWLWRDGTGTGTAGHVTLDANTADREPVVCFSPIERQADGGLARPSQGPECARGIPPEDSHLNVGAQQGPLYRIDIEEGGPVLTRSAVDEASSTPLPDTLVTEMDPTQVWLSAWGDTVIVGDGNSRAWTIRWRDGWGGFELLPGEVVSAQPFEAEVPNAAPGPPTAERTLNPSEPAAVPTCDGSATQPAACTEPPILEGLPAPVADTAMALFEAAVDRDWAGLEALLPEDGQFTSNFGGNDDHIGHYQQAEAAGEDVFGALKAILSMPYAKQDGMYVWPFAHVENPESLSSAEMELLATHFSQEEIDSWIEYGSYLGWRVGIDETGAWRYFVAGD